MNWTMNTTQLETGMLIRRPGMEEALEVVQVRNGQAKIKLPGGKTSTIPVAAEVEFTWPEKGAEPKSNSQPKSALESLTENVKAEHEINETPDDGSDWQTDWSLLDVGAKISVLGESGDFTVLRLTDSSARIKSNSSGQIAPLTIGHKFKMIESSKKESKPANRKSRNKRSAPVATPEPEPEPETEPEANNDSAGDQDDNPGLPFDDNGADLQGNEIPTFASDEEQEADPVDDNENDLDSNLTDSDEQENDMPKSKPASSPKSSGQLLTLVEIAERTGISYPTLSRYVREHGNRLPSEGSGRKRRFYESAIDIFREIRGESRSGRKPKDGSKRAAAKAPRKVKVTREALAGSKQSESSKSTMPSRGGAVSVAAWVPATGQTIDSMLASAIDHAKAQITGLQSLIDNLEAQREQLKLWS